jgi:predicted metalloprotease with PDZ domain
VAGRVARGGGSVAIPVWAVVTGSHWCSFMRLAILLTLALSRLALAAHPHSGALGIQYRLDDGVIVLTDVVKGSPAENAGLRKDDVLFKINSVAAESVDGVADEIRRHNPERQVEDHFQARQQGDDRRGCRGQSQ